MDSLRTSFEERLQEIETYLDLLDVLEKQARKGAPKIGKIAITSQQQKILYSSVYLQLYNLVEATITWCVEAVSSATVTEAWIAADLTDLVRREWVRAEARTHVEMGPDKRLEAAVKMSERLVKTLPVLSWSIKKGSSGNWDENDINDVTTRLGCRLKLSKAVLRGIKEPIRDNKGALVLVKDFRNRLAHGQISFSECGEGVTVKDLRKLQKQTTKYLRAVVKAFSSFIDKYEFIVKTNRPKKA